MNSYLDEIMRLLTDLFDDNISVSKYSPEKGNECLFIQDFRTDDSIEVYYTNRVYRVRHKGKSDEYKAFNEEDDVNLEERLELLHGPVLLVNSLSNEETESSMAAMTLEYLSNFMQYTSIYINYYTQFGFAESAIWRPAKRTITGDW